MYNNTTIDIPEFGTWRVVRRSLAINRNEHKQLTFGRRKGKLCAEVRIWGKAKLSWTYTHGTICLRFFLIIIVRYSLFLPW
jgi:hypothetical protein